MGRSVLLFLAVPIGVQTLRKQFVTRQLLLFLRTFHRVESRGPWCKKKTLMPLLLNKNGEG